MSRSDGHSGNGVAAEGLIGSCSTCGCHVASLPDERIDASLQDIKCFRRIRALTLHGIQQ